MAALSPQGSPQHRMHVFHLHLSTLPSSQNFMHVPSNRGEMLEVIYDRMAIPLLFLDVSYMVTLK